ncbi:MAG: Ldh family oxidoreductase [Roseovarius sp.]
MSAQNVSGPRYAQEELQAFAADIFVAEGLPRADAETMAKALVAANLRGVDTHGILRVPAYVRRLRAGLINPTPQITTTARRAFASVIDADNAMGPVAMAHAIQACRASVETLGIGAATVRRSNHFGAASVHTVPLAREGCIAMTMSPGSKSLAPHGSRAPLLGTNPMAVAAPTGRYAPWSLDMAASVAARGHIRLAEQEGKPIPEGWALDEAGRPTTDPAAAMRGVVLPFGGPKGSALSMMVDIFAGILAGAGFAGSTRDWNADFSGPSDVGHFLLVMKIDAFMDLYEFETRMETAIDRLKALPTAEGVDEVLYPGERAGRSEAARRADGVPLGLKATQELAALGAEHGLFLPAPL